MPDFKRLDAIVTTRELYYLDGDNFRARVIPRGTNGVITRANENRYLWHAVFDTTGGKEILVSEFGFKLVRPKLTSPGEDRELAEQAVLDSFERPAEPLRYDEQSFDRLKLAASAIVAEWRKSGTADRDELRRNLAAALAEVETPADKFRLLAQKFAEPMVHGGYTRTDTLTFTVDGLERFVAAVFAEGLES